MRPAAFVKTGSKQPFAAIGTNDFNADKAAN